MKHVEEVVEIEAPRMTAVDRASAWDPRRALLTGGEPVEAPTQPPTRFEHAHPA